METKILKLKVFKNKRTGQASIVLPKRVIKRIPRKMEVRW